MKKLLLSVSLVSTLFSTVSIASESDYAGFRLGGGYSNTSVKLDGYSEYSEEGIKMEVGYDFNRIIGIDTSYETVGDTLGNVDADINGSVVKLGVDFGYAFYSKSAFLKPYISLGGVSLSEGGSDKQSIYGGLGVRFEYHHFYGAVSIDGFYLDSENADNDYERFVQSGFTVGYKF